MKTTHSQYRINPRLIIALVVLVGILAVVGIYIWLRAPDNKDAPDDTSATPTNQVTADSNLAPTEAVGVKEGTNIETIDSSQLTPDYINTNFICVELSIVGTWTSSNPGKRYKVYKDQVNNTFSKWLVTNDESGNTSEKQLVTNLIYNGSSSPNISPPNDITLCSTNTIAYMSDGFYQISNIQDGFGWVGSMIASGYQLLYTSIRNDLIDVYFSKDGVNYRAVITNNYIVFNKFSGTLPEM